MISDRHEDQPEVDERDRQRRALIRRCRKLTGPESAIAMKPAMKIHVSGLRSR